MTDPNNPARDSGAQPGYTPPPASTTPPPADANPAYTAPAYVAPAYPSDGVPAASNPGKAMGIVAFVLSFFVQLVALILGIIALVQSKRAGAGNGWALAAIIISAVGLVIGAIVFFALILPSLSAAATCASDPTAIVTVWGVSIPCSELLER